jgi:hypothetical protein
LDTAVTAAKPASDDRIAVAAAKAAIAGGTYTDLVVVDTAQPTKTAAVQAVVDGLKGTTTAVVTFDTDHYDVAISQDAASDSTTVAPVTFLQTINIAAIVGVTVPAKDGVPVTIITDSDQYTGTVTWNPTDNPFAAATDYTATIRLTAKAGYTLTGVGAGYFTVDGTTYDNNPANSGVITAVFPTTGL